MTDPERVPIFTWDDVEWLRREAARRERRARRSGDRDEVVASLRSAERLRSLADRIGKELKRSEAA